MLYQYNKKYSKVVFRVLICMIVLIMPYHFNLTNACIILLTLNWIIEGSLNYKREQLFRQPVIIIFIILYILFCVGSLYSSNISVSTSNLEQKFSLLVLPLVIGTSKHFGKNERLLALNSFLITCLLATLVCWFYAVYRYLITYDSNVFYYEELSSAIDFHPPYFGMYLGFGILILIHQLFSKNNIITIPRNIIITLVFFFFLFVIFLSARTTIIFLILPLVGMLVKIFYKTGKRIIGMLMVIILFGVASFIIFNSDFLKDRIMRPLTSDITITGGGGETGLSMRIVKWKCSIEGMLEHPFFGVGTGDSIDYLVSCYERKNFWGMLPQYRFNSHNQYLETGLMLGFVGLFLFMLCIILPACKAFKDKDYLSFGFIALFSFCCLTESLLERQWGIAFFTFFISVLSFGPKNINVK